MSGNDAESRDVKRGASPESRGRNPRGQGAGVSVGTARMDDFCPKAFDLMEAAVGRENMMLALKRVKSNKGSAGVDGMTVSGLHDWLRDNWPRVRAELMGDRYIPSPVLKVEIPKPGGKGMRQLGIPTVLDRLIQQALLQVLQPVFEPGFSGHSYGFRPGRSAHDALASARAYVADGRRWVVDMDLEKFFDRVNHDILMSRVARKVGDKLVLRLIRRYLQSGMMADGVLQQRFEGTPQGGPLSPLLSNILLDDLDKELERRGHCFCRYADDCNIYVRSKRSGDRVMDSISSFLEKRLKLKVNADKSSVDRPWNRKFLGYSMTWHKDPRLKVAPDSVKRFKVKLKVLFRQGRGRNLGRFIRDDLVPVIRGWSNYFRLAKVKGVFDVLDRWIRRNLRCILWRQWKLPYTRARNLIRLGSRKGEVWNCVTNGSGPWYSSNVWSVKRALPKSYFKTLGLVSLLDQLRRFQRIT